ncbi:MAG TPA: diacylglycerol kinase [Acidimicrobiia bacterium]|nr:diacylglycerol kinase [Acidimicrobiia bacterium]
MTMRVIQWSTGNVGRSALRCIIQDPALELVGVWVHSADKAGKDAGELCGLPPTGVLATNDADALLALDADCVSYTATADLRPMDAINEMARIAASGKNIVSSSVVPLIWPVHVDPAMRAPLEDACLAAGVSCLTSGIDPGWANDALPLLLTGTCERVDHLRVMEIVNYKDYEQPTVLFDTMGFGQALDAQPLLLLPGVLSFAWGGVVKVLAEGLGVEIEELREVHERRPAPDKIDLGFGVVEEGTTAALRFEVQGIVAGEPRIVVEHVTRLDDALCPDWPQPIGAGGYRVVVTGTPSYQCDVQMTAKPGEGDPGVIGTAGRIVRAIPAVCAARPGLLSALDLPLIGGRGAMHV